MENLKVDSKEDIKFWLKPKNLSIGLIIGGFLLYIIAYILIGFIPKIDADTTLSNKIFIYIFSIILEIAKLIGSVLLSSGFVSLLLEISTIRKTVLYVYDNLIKRILNADFDLSNYSPETLENFQRKIVIQNSNGKLTPDMLNNSIYKLIKYLNTLLLGLFHQKHNVKYYITPDEESNVFRKRVESEYEIINNFKLKNKVHLQIAFPDESDIIDEKDKLRKLKISKFMINNTNLLQEVEKLKRISLIENNKSNLYNYCVIFERELQECQKHTVVIHYEYTVPLSDFRQVYRLQLPCKKMMHEIYLEGTRYNCWKLSVSGFASFFYSNSEIEKDFVVEEPTNWVGKVNFNNWVLPGSGYVVTFKKNDSKISSKEEDKNDY